MLGIYRNPNWKEFLKSCESFLRKFQFSTLTDLNHGFGKPWEMVWKFFYKCQLHNASKEVVWPNFFLDFMHGFKSAILSILQFWPNGTFETVHEIQNCFRPKDFFWSIMKVTFTKISLTCPRVRQIQNRKLRFSQKGLTRFQKLFLFRVSMST